MTKEIGFGILLTAIIVGTFAWYEYGDWWTPLFARFHAQPAPPPQASPAPAAPEAPPHHPVPAGAETGTPLPDLQNSDDAFRASLEDVFGKKVIADFLDPEKIIAKIVATIDSLDNAAPIPLRDRAVSNVPGLFQVQKSGDGFELAPSNAARYKPLMLALKAADAGMIVKVYLHFYPLFQQAYHELGYPDADFNDRLIAIIDHLMQAPDLKGPVKLVRPKVLYQFADPGLEQRSSGHKLLMRLGPENEGIVKGKLNEIRGLLVPQQAPSPQPRKP